MDNFLKHWFGGFQESFQSIDAECRNWILGNCGRACSSSYPLQVYLDAKNNSGSEDEFINQLKKSFIKTEINIIEKGRKYEISYGSCECDLIKSGYITDPAFCECSRASLQYNWEAVYGTGNIEAEMVQTILAGAPSCKFIVTIK